MGNKKIWTDDKIRDGIMAIVAANGEKRMPTSDEIVAYCGGYGLLSAMRRSGGAIRWGEILGLPTGADSTLLGWRHERYAQQQLQKRGHIVDHYGRNNPYDLLADQAVKIEVKTAHLTGPAGKREYTCRLRQPHRADIVIVYCLADGDAVAKTYIIPAHVLHNISQLTVGRYHSKYDNYIDRWDLVDKLIASFTALEVHDDVLS